jgi:ubiquinone/menaquinone biosynthesis C-methylase UbiE
MHRMRNEPKTKDGPETAGRTLHWAGEYDFFTRLMGMGANGRNTRMVIERADVKPGESVLDVACGTGNLTLTAKTYAGPAGRVHGIDAAPEMIELARKKAARAGAEVAFDVGLAEKLSFPDATFDVVISRLAMHHLPGDLQRAAFAEMLRVLKPGGRVLIADFVAPSNHALGHIMSALVGPSMMQSSAWSLPPMLANAGFAEVASAPMRSGFLGVMSGKKPTGG